jgi:Ca2+-binding RTX toxin-like protein
MRFFKKTRKSSVRPQRKHRKLGVEKCEDRLMMATWAEMHDYYITGDLVSKLGSTDTPTVEAMKNAASPRVHYIRKSLVGQVSEWQGGLTVPNQYGTQLPTDATVFVRDFNLVIKGTGIRDIIKVQEFASGYVLNGYSYPYYYISVNPEGPARETVFRVQTAQVPNKAIYVFGSAGDDNIEFIDRGLKPGTTKFIADGGTGADLIKGGPGNDFLDGGTDDSAADILYGGGGHDVLAGGGGNDQLRGEADRDLLWGDDGDDRFWGGIGIDCLFGGDGKDTMQGDNDADYLFGGANIDSLNGGPGNDYLDGGQDGFADTMYGNVGVMDNRDKFVVEWTTTNTNLEKTDFNKNDPDSYVDSTGNAIAVDANGKPIRPAGAGASSASAMSMSLALTTPVAAKKKK